jgi:acylphosphatase
MSAVRVVVSGRVQGVAYRYWTQVEAQRRGLNGFVRNLRDGSVEAVFFGEPDVLNAMVQACRRGPALAKVDDVRVRPIELEPMSSFEILATL